MGGLVQRHQTLLGQNQCKDERLEGLGITSPTQSRAESMTRSGRIDTLHSRNYHRPGEAVNSWSRFFEGETSLGRRAVERELMAAMNFGIFQPRTCARVQTVAALSPAGCGGAGSCAVDNQSLAPQVADADVSRRATG